MQQELLWDDLRYFLAVARAESLTNAGRRLRVSASTVSRRIDALERALGCRLFHRKRDGYTLTIAGRDLIADAEAAEARVLALQRNAGSNPAEVAGTVRLVTPELLANELIVPRLGAFCAANPSLSLELLNDVRPVSLAHDEADVVVRAVRPTQGAYVLRRLAALDVCLFAAEDYIARNGVPDAGALARHRLISWDRDLAFLEMARWLARIAPEAQVVLRTTTFAAQLGACRAGCGLAALPAPIAERYRLRRVLAEIPPLRLDLWLMVRPDIRTLRRVQAVCDFLAAVLVDPDG